MILDFLILDSIFSNTPLALVLLLCSGIIGFLIAWYSKKTEHVVQNFAPEENFKSENHKLKKELRNLSDENSSLQNSKSELEEKLSAINNDFDIFRNQHSDVNDKISTLETDSNKWESKFKKLEIDGQKWKAQIDEAKKGRKELKAEYDNSQRSLNELKRKSTGQAAHITDLEEKIQQLKTDSENQATLKSENKKLQARVKKAEVDIKYWEKEHYTAHHELAALKENQGNIEAKSIQVQATLDQVNMERKKLTAEVSEYKEKFMDINKKYQSTWNKINDLEKMS